MLQHISTNSSVHQKLYRFLFALVIIALFASYGDLGSKAYTLRPDDETRSIFVSTEGSDDSLGTFESPLKTIQRAIDLANPGTTVFIRGGIYYEKLEFNTEGSLLGGYITLRPYANETVTLDGSKTDGSDMIFVLGKSYIKILDITIANNVNTYSTGIHLRDGASHILISGIDMYNISTSNPLGSSERGEANPIISLSSYWDKPNKDITIIDNHIHDNHVGRSEAITITQNTDGFIIKNNLIHDISNIGIDVAGHYGHFHGNSSYNQARNGIISGNVIYNCHSSYGEGAASGIYVDGGRDVVVSDNTVYSNDYGISVSCESTGNFASNIIITDNTVYDNDKSGITVGGNEHIGKVINSKILGNVVFSNNKSEKSYHGELTINYTEDSIDILNNIFYQTSGIFTDTDMYSPVIQYRYNNPKINMDHNIYLYDTSSDNLVFWVGNDKVIGLNSFRKITGFDLGSVSSLPTFELSHHSKLYYTPNNYFVDLYKSLQTYMDRIDFSFMKRFLHRVITITPTG